MMQKVNDMIYPDNSVTLPIVSDGTKSAVMNKIDGQVISMRLGDTILRWDKYYGSFRISRFALKDLKVEQLYCNESFIIRSFEGEGIRGIYSYR
jgi:hypothetical protein